MSKFKITKHVFLTISLLFSASVLAAGEPRVGRQAAGEYFQSKPSRSTAASAGDGVLMLHIGGYSSSDAYKWKGSEKRTGVGKATYGVTYVFDQWGSADVNFRADFSEYQLDEKRPTKLSLMPLITFPGADSRFPLYFGAGAGLGVFFTQIEDESNIAFDYQLVVGARFMDLYENFGFSIEYAMKNHLHLLSDGQFNGSGFSLGAVFTF